MNFGGGQRATYLSLMRVGGAIDDELPVKRVEVAGHPDKLFGRLRQLVDQDFTVVFSAPNYRARQDMMLAFVERGLPIAERLDVGRAPTEVDVSWRRAPRERARMTRDGETTPSSREAALRVSDESAARRECASAA